MQRRKRRARVERGAKQGERGAKEEAPKRARRATFRESGAAWPKKSVVQSERGARRAWCADGRDQEEAWWAWCARGLVRKKRVVQGERGARRAARCKESSVVQRRKR